MIRALGPEDGEELAALYLANRDFLAPFELRPQAEIWIKRREPWLHEIEGASQHDENRLQN